MAIVDAHTQMNAGHLACLAEMSTEKEGGGGSGAVLRNGAFA